MTRTSRWALLLRPRILAALSYTAPLTTTEIVERVEDQLRAEGEPLDWFGRPRLTLPGEIRCICGHVHDCPTRNRYPVSTGILKPQLDFLAKAGLVAKHSRGTPRSCLWLLAEVKVPDTVGEILAE